MDERPGSLFLATLDGHRGEPRHGKLAGAVSVSIHCGLIALLYALASGGSAPATPRQRPWRISRVLLLPYTDSKPSAGGGGGGGRSPLPANLGAAPRFAPRQFVPPSPPVSQQQPRWLVEPTLVGPPNLRPPSVDAKIWGDPTALPGPPSPGPGCCGGIGDGRDGGIGPGFGPGLGPGERGGFASVYVPGRNGVTAPIPIYQVEPDYSDEARKAHFQGTVVLQIVIDEHGNPTNFSILSPLGLGLDQKAVEAVKQWRFRPGMKDGKPVAVVAKIYVTFRLL